MDSFAGYSVAWQKLKPLKTTFYIILKNNTEKSIPFNIYSIISYSNLSYSAFIKKKGFGLPSCNKDRYINFYLCAIIDAIFTFKDKSSLLGLLWGFSQTLNE